MQPWAEIPYTGQGETPALVELEYVTPFEEGGP